MEQASNSNDISDPNLYKSLPDLIGQVLNGMGRFQIILLGALCFSNVIVGISHTLTTFHTYTPEFYCKDYNTTVGCDFGNDSCPSGFIFNGDDHTIVSEWSLVCSRRLLLPLINTFYFIGVAMGAIVFGILADKYGRKKILMICLITQGALGVILRGSTRYEWFTVIRMVQGFFVQGLQGTAYNLLFEYVAPRLQTLACFWYEINWSVGLTILGGISYAIREWHMLQIMLSIPSFVVFLFIWRTPESIYWLYASNRIKEALNLCIKTAKLNGNHAIIQNHHLNLEELARTADNDKSFEIDAGKKTAVLDIIRIACLQKHLSIMVVVWFGVTLSYYGILFFMPNTAEDRHVDFIIGSLIEIVFFIFGYFMFKCFGRRVSLIWFLFINGLSCLAIGLIITFGPEYSEIKDWSIIILTSFAKGLAAVSFYGMTVYTSELFPTICRGTAFGTCVFSSRIGSLLSPFLMNLVDYFSAIAPMTILGILLLLASTLLILLPETLRISVPNTMDDAKKLWNSDK